MASAPVLTGLRTRIPLTARVVPRTLCASLGLVLLIVVLLGLIAAMASAGTVAEFVAALAGMLLVAALAAYVVVLLVRGARRGSLLIGEEDVVVVHPWSLRAPATIERSDVRAVAIDDGSPERPRERFPRYSDTGGDTQMFLWIRRRFAAFPLLGDRPAAPNLALLFERPVRIDARQRRPATWHVRPDAPAPVRGRPVGGLLLSVEDPDLLMPALSSWDPIVLTGSTGASLTERELGPPPVTTRPPFSVWELLIVAPFLIAVVLFKLGELLLVPLVLVPALLAHWRVNGSRWDVARARALDELRERGAWMTPGQRVAALDEFRWTFGGERTSAYRDVESHFHELDAARGAIRHDWRPRVGASDGASTVDRPAPARRSWATVLSAAGRWHLAVPLVVIVLAFATQKLRGDEFRVPTPVLAQPGQNPAPRPSLTQRGLYLVPMDGTPRQLVAQVGRRLARGYPVRIRILEHLRSEPYAYDAGRRQLVGDQLIRQLAHAYPVSNRSAGVIGVTDADLYWADAPGDRFAFGVVNDAGYAAISTARMNPRNYRDRPDFRLLEARLEKMTARYLARLVFNLQPISTDRRSALRDSIRDLDDLDETTGRICPDRPRSLEPC